MVVIFSEKGNQLQCCDDHFMIADFGTADGGGFIRILPNLVGKTYSTLFHFYFILLQYS